MKYTRREFGKVALAAVPAVALMEKFGTATLLGQAKPNSMFKGVQIGTITYSYRSMPDQSGVATLKYLVDSGISACELMGGPAEQYAGAPQAPARGRVAAPPAPAAAAGAPAPAAGRAAPTPEQLAYQADLKKWRLSVSMDKFKALRKMYNDAGVNIYAVKIMNPSMSDDELDYVFNVAAALGANHTTTELPTKIEDLKRLGSFAEKHKIYAAYHTHLQGKLTVFDDAFAASKGNMANIDFGHYVAGGGGDPLLFLNKFHDRIASFHLKDRQTPAHGAANLPWGQGDTPIKALLTTVEKNGWKMPATIEQEYEIPQGSNAVIEVKKCVQFCKDALA